MDAYFAGRVFVPGEQKGCRFFLWGNSTLPHERRDGEMLFSASYAEPAEGAFLCQLQSGWLFVTGTSPNQNFRHTFFDDSDQATENAEAMRGLGIEVLTLETANQRVKADGVTLYSITADERQRAEALARTEH